MDGTPTSSRDLGQEAYARIRAAIRGGALAPGERLTETDLAARFGVSKSCVREAIIGSRWGHLDGALAPRRHKRST